MNRFVRVTGIPNISALAWELAEKFPEGSHLFCLTSDFAEELREELSSFSEKPIYLLPTHDIDAQTQRRPALHERKERLRFINALKNGEKAYYLWTASALFERSLPWIFASWETEFL